MNIQLLLKMLGVTEETIKEMVTTQVMPMVQSINEEYKNVDQRYTAMFDRLFRELVVISDKLDAIDRVLTLEGIAAPGDQHSRIGDGNGPLIAGTVEGHQQISNGAHDHE